MVTGSVHEYRLTAAAKRIDNRVFLSRIYLSVGVYCNVLKHKILSWILIHVFLKGMSP